MSMAGRLDAVMITCREIKFEINKGAAVTSPVRPREAPPFKVGKQARLRVNLEQAPAFRPGSREVHFRASGENPYRGLGDSG